MTTNTQSNNLKQLEIRQVRNFFLSIYEPASNNRGRPSILKPPDIAVITMIQKQYQIKTLKSLYLLLLSQYSDIFGKLPAYQNFVVSMNKNSTFLLQVITIVIKAGKIYRSNIKFIDSTPIPVCKVYRSFRHKTMKLLASKKKSTTGWFYGLKLHLMCDENYNLDAIKFTTAKVDDRVVLNNFRHKTKDSRYKRYSAQNVPDTKLVADAGYLSKQEEIKFWNSGIYFLTASRNNMKILTTLYQQKLMNMRSKVETVFSSLKDKYQLINPNHEIPHT